MKTLTITLTPEDIELGVIDVPGQCAIARAIKRHLPDSNPKVCVGHEEVIDITNHDVPGGIAMHARGNAIPRDDVENRKTIMKFVEQFDEPPCMLDEWHGHWTEGMWEERCRQHAMQPYPTITLQLPGS